VYGRQTQNAISIVSLLAEIHDEQVAASAARIARERHIAQTTVAKILSVLSTAGIVTGKTGPGGGFRLAREPGEITVFEVFTLFERGSDQGPICPFGGGVCGGDDPCPLHERLADVSEAMDRLLHETTFAIFRKGGEPRPPRGETRKRARS
jgi:Rrf2 family protein